MILDLLANSSADFFERLLSRDVGNTGTGSIQSVDSKIGSENDQGFRKIDSIAAARSQYAIVKHLQKVVENSGMGFLNFVEEHHAERLFANCVGEFTTYIIAYISRRGANQSLVGVLGAEFRHIKTNVSTLIAKQQFSDRFCQLC